MPNKTRLERVPVATMADGTDAVLHVHHVEGGAGDGPTVGISAGIHGNENTGSQIVRSLWPVLSSTPFRGRVVLLPVANPRALAKNRRYTPVDELNLNRHFPGDREGWHTEQIAAAVTESFLEKIDVHLDLHSGTDRPTVDYVYIMNDERLSRAFGSRVLYRPQEGRAGTTFSGTTKDVTVTGRGIPSVVVELGGGIVDQTPYVERGVRGVLNVLKAAGTLEGPPDPLPEQTVVHEIRTVRPTQGGWLETEAPPLGGEIAGGEVLGRVVSPYTFEELEVIRSPLERGVVILSHLTRNLVEPGDYGYMVGDLEGAER
jgi:predicted deacylase